MAGSYSIARMFVTNDLRDDERRLKYLNHPNDLRGMRGITVIIHPTAPMHRDYQELMHMTRYQGLYVMRFDDSFDRARYQRKQEERQCKVQPAMATVSAEMSPSADPLTPSLLPSHPRALLRGWRVSKLRSRSGLTGAMNTTKNRRQVQAQ